MPDESAAPGTYLLLLECQRTGRLTVGKLGEMHVDTGYYLYVGSAYGPGGVRARIGHHHKIATSAHWHIDYLRKISDVLDVWCVYHSRCEHDWARKLIRDATATVPLPGFGASDCDCASHLFYFRQRPLKNDVEVMLGSQLEALPQPQLAGFSVAAANEH